MTKFTTTHIVFFSPTHTSAKTARAIAEGIGMERRIETDLTLDEGNSPIEINDSLTLFAAPVYGGRISPIALQRIRRVKGHNSPAIVVAVYGNRDYEDALLELRDVVASQGFTPLAAGAFIGEHSYSTPEMPIAAGRPDANDIQKAHQFGEACLKKLQNWNGEPETFFIKGNFPYKQLHAAQPSAPVCNEQCFVCGECVEVCPTHAISISTDGCRIETDINRCIRCCACVKECPNEARIYTTPFTAYLYQNFSARREPELFL